MWSRLADDIEAITALVGPGAAGWPLLGVTWEQVDHGVDGQALEARAETSDGDTDLVGLWFLDDDGKPPARTTSCCASFRGSERRPPRIRAASSPRTPPRVLPANGRGGSASGPSDQPAQLKKGQAR